jgi:beta-phosphoglucomutase family hydrolase
MLTLMTPDGPRPCDAMLFDMDGTMVDSRPFHLQAWEELSDRLWPGEDRSEIFRQTFGLSNRAIIPQLGGPEMTAERVEALSEEKEALYRRLAAGNLEVIPGLEEVVRLAVQAGVGLAVASSAPEANVRFVLEELGMERDFDTTVFDGCVQHGKPAPDTFLLAAERLGVDPARCIVFEDAPAGLEGARRAGMIVVGIQTHFGQSLEEWADLLAPDFRAVFERLRQ